jgi:uncharacterized alkaline shock family protein YloU
MAIITFSVSKIMLGRFQREKTIAFTNPEGQVTVSLSAIEDLIRKAATQVPEIKDLRSDVRANKKGTIFIGARMTLWSDSNIPEVTERAQSLIKAKIQDMLGLEETVICSVHISKIVPREESRKKRQDASETGEDMFRGAIEYSEFRVKKNNK